ncbi:collectrin-like [Bubalus kerabau]|uniref:collectrin-like n=1 Tax=Bubalus carabanensis TaxID=3119969 RepID=UPI00244E797D|nr:collectrin-like [Bubalus carabanensis]
MGRDSGQQRQQVVDQQICLVLRGGRLNEEDTRKILMRKQKRLQISHVLLCNVTQRVSFWFVVTDPSRNHTLPAVEVQSAIRMNRNRINNAFFLNDQTLEFLRIPSTLAPPTDPSVPIWIIIFGVIFCIVLVATMLLIFSGIRQHRRVSQGQGLSQQEHHKWQVVLRGNFQRELQLHCGELHFPIQSVLLLSPLRD